MSSEKEAVIRHFNPVPELEKRLAERGKNEILDDILRLNKLAKIHYVYQQQLNGLGDAVLQAKAFCGNESFAVETYNGHNRFYCTPSNAKPCADPGAVRCTHFVGNWSPIDKNEINDTITVHPWSGNIYLRCDGLSSVSALKTWLQSNPVTVVYPVADSAVYRFTAAKVDMRSGTSYIMAGKLPAGNPAPTLSITTTCSGWDTLNSAEDIRAAQTEIQVQQQNAQAAIDELRTAVVTDNEGVHVRKVDNDDVQLIQNEVLITQNDVNIVSNGKRNSTFGSGYIRLLDMVIRAASGGIVIEAAEV